MKKIYVMYKDELISKIEYDYPQNKVTVENYIDEPVLLPFGINTSPTIEDLEYYLESRCFPRDRVNCKELLKLLDVQCYDPMAIVRKTHGVQNEDYCWLKFGDDDRTVYEDVRFRD
ncbi:MAG: hypothetical protein PUB89_14735 [Oscillospiraceae bacterium]|nr:hypothetical protein [Oscillospiraceae bacterium]MDD6084066.1 hypothetical protein [Oscillospiraceae bacterium]